MTAQASRFVGRCKLCLQNRPLCDSHLIPAAIYKLIRSATVTPADPLVITQDTTFTSSKQASDYLLCTECEDRFRRSGEDWVIRHCYRMGVGFTLRDLVLAARLLDDGDLAKLYSTQSNPAINADALAYFALSVFWRASAHRWHFLGRDWNAVTLGPYEEGFRKYLLGEGAFPQTAVLWVWVSQYDAPSRAVTMPSTRREHDLHVHSFDIPGIRFDVFVGKKPSEVLRRVCIVTAPERPILLSEAPDDILATHVGRFSKTSRVSEKLQGKGKWTWNLFNS